MVQRRNIRKLLFTLKSSIAFKLQNRASLFFLNDPGSRNLGNALF